MDQVLSHGLTSLGVHVGPMPRNCQGKPGDCSAHCVLGCSHGHKRDMLTTYLHDACRDGAVCLTEAYAARIVTAPAGKAARLVAAGTAGGASVGSDGYLRTMQAGGGQGRGGASW